MDSRHVTFAPDSKDAVEFQDKLVEIQESYSSFELTSPHQTDKCLNTVIFQVQSTLLNHHPLYLQTSKNEFAALLLKALGPARVTSSVVNDLFDEIDVDKDGWLSTEELARYMIKVEQRSRREVYQFFFNKLAKASILGSLMFLVASSLSITKNLFLRFYHGNHLFTDLAAEMVVWMSLIGSFMFLWSALQSTVQQMREEVINEQSGSSSPQCSKIYLLIQGFMTIGQIINTFWVLGSIAYMAERWLAGGLCYFAGGVLAFPSLYRTTLDELVQNQELLSKLCSTYPEKYEVDEELGAGILHCHSPRLFDNVSVRSDLTNTASKEEEFENAVQKMPYEGLHKRLRTDSNVMSLFHNLHATDEPLPGHKRTPTCPDLFKRTSLATDQTGETESLTHTECTISNNQINFLGKDILLEEKYKGKSQLECYDAFISFSKDQLNLDSSFRVIKRLSESNCIDIDIIRQMTTGKAIKELRELAFRQQFYLPSLYISIAYTLGGLMFTIGECNLGLSLSTIQNIYLTGSSLYFCGSIGILYRAWMNVSNEWNVFQHCRSSLHTLTFPDDTFDEKQKLADEEDGYCRESIQMINIKND